MNIKTTSNKINKRKKNIKNIKSNINKQVPNPKINNNKRKINIINLANSSKYKNPSTKKFSSEDSDSSNSNSLILDSDEISSRNKYLIAKKAKIKKEKNGNTLISSANESCNIQESDISKLSISGIDARGAGRIKYI